MFQLVKLGDRLRTPKPVSRDANGTQYECDILLCDCTELNTAL